jgi:hypothetical protein
VRGVRTERLCLRPQQGLGAFTPDIIDDIHALSLSAR